MHDRLKLLLVEDSQDDVDLLMLHLRKEGIEVQYDVVDSEETLSRALATDWDAIICDYNLPHFDALKAIHVTKGVRPDIPLIVMSGTVGEAVAVDTIKAGASDYVMKGNMIRVVPAIQRAVNERVFRIENRQIEETLRQKEEELRQRQKLEAIGQLAGGIAHDFNNILGAILMELDFLSDELDAGLPPEKALQSVRSGLARVRDSGERATILTRQLLAFSRKQIIQPKVQNVNLMVQSIEKMLRPIVEESIEFRLDLSSDAGNIKVDPGHFEQILMNLVINARDAMFHGGVLEISTRKDRFNEKFAELYGAKPGTYVSLIVRDSGCGISPEVQKRLFEPFFTTKPTGKGTGLGLSTVYGIVKQNRGLIFVESEVGKGTAFKVFFPWVNEEVQDAESTPATSPGLGGNETVLFVEDEEALRDVASKALEKNGYKVLTATNGAEAWMLASTYPETIHLVITDVVMPQMGGTELATKIQTLGRGTKIIFQSGYTEDTLIQNGVRAGQIQFLEKPYNMKSFLATVRRVLS